MRKKILIGTLITLTLLATACTNAPGEETENLIKDTDTEVTENNNLTTNNMETAKVETEMQVEPQTGNTIAVMKTNMGEMKILLYTDLAPETTTNFIEHVESGRYEGVIFHRVIEDFMIQTGDFENMNGTGGHSYKGPGTYLEDEFGEGLTHLKGALSMANAGPNTGGSQFFIVQSAAGTDFLDGKHAIFGIVYEGLGVVDEIADVEIGLADRPVEDVIIESIEILTY